jgi:hypothetical protein
MLPLAHTGFFRSNRAGFGAAVVVLAWLALWFAVLVATLERPYSRRHVQSENEAIATSRA